MVDLGRRRVLGGLTGSALAPWLGHAIFGVPLRHLIATPAAGAAARASVLRAGLADITLIRIGIPAGTYPVGLLEGLIVTAP